MHLKTIFNRVTDYKPFVVDRVELVEDSLSQPTIEIIMRARENGLPTCSGCGCRCSGYDTLPIRRFDFIPLWLIAVVLVYAMRRVNCSTCGVKVERVPWATGKNRLTLDYQWFLAGWARRMSWKESSRSVSTKFNGNAATSIKHWCTKSMRAASDSSGLVPTARPRRCFGSFDNWARNGQRCCSLFAAICGRLT